ncbi:hypothetical protein [Gramella sp. KN1008]|uniref:hypothetical protein n=1 Tax=Gramella sp. KN1008 TaxID=2529298 RepID=UPI001040CE31|nr:hypothetical protein [Gramella sp. KN1008]TBW28259.1 hypothetical protein EZJ28_05800 [Gramella sp. KN1008]
MLKKYTLICLALVCFNTQAQSTTQNEWDRNLNVLAETLPMFDIKIYESSNPNIAIKIKNYSIEDDFLVVSVWERATRKSNRSVFDLRCLTDVDLTCETSCSLTLIFDGAVIPDINNDKTRIILSNCEVVSKKGCNRITWSQEDNFVKTAKQAFQKIIKSN